MGMEVTWPTGGSVQPSFIDIEHAGATLGGDRAVDDKPTSNAGAPAQRSPAGVSRSRPGRSGRSL